VMAFSGGEARLHAGPRGFGPPFTAHDHDEIKEAAN
jgi:hypothetical protein